MDDNPHEVLGAEALAIYSTKAIMSKLDEIIKFARKKAKEFPEIYEVVKEGIGQGLVGDSPGIGWFVYTEIDAGRRSVDDIYKAILYMFTMRYASPIITDSFIVMQKNEVDEIKTQLDSLSEGEEQFNEIQTILEAYNRIIEMYDEVKDVLQKNREIFKEIGEIAKEHGIDQAVEQVPDIIKEHFPTPDEYIKFQKEIYQKHENFNLKTITEELKLNVPNDPTPLSEVAEQILTRMKLTSDKLKALGGYEILDEIYEKELEIIARKIYGS